MTIKLFPSNELLGATALHSVSATDLRLLRSDPRSFLLSRTNVAVGEDVSFNFSENDVATVHLALPYYSEIEEMNIKALEPQELSDVSGGEIIALVIFGLTTAAATIGTAVGIASTPVAIGVGAAIIAGSAVAAGTAVIGTAAGAGHAATK